MIGFYISIIYVIGKLFRVIVSGSLTNFTLSDIPNPDNILKICDAIIVARTERDLGKLEKKKSILLYFNYY